MVVLRPGEYYVTDQDEIIATVLGSCISVCVKDEKNQIAGMNHFMLPGDLRQSDDFTTHSARYGMYAMELLLGEIIKLGGDREHLTAKVFGGGHVLQSVAKTIKNVPDSNIKFARAFLDMEGIKVLKSDVGGRLGRKILYLPRLGKVFVKKLVPEAEPDLARREVRYHSRLKRESESEGLTLF